MDGRTWILCTKCSADDAYKLAKYASNILNNFGYDLELKENIRSGVGFTDVHHDGSIHYEVGVKELVENPRREISLREFLAPTVACFHEVCGHGGQWRNEIMKDEPLSKVLLLSDMACKGSCEYYGVIPLDTDPLPQYFEHPHEIAAQYMGLKMTQKFLSVVYSEEKADEMLCEYVNLRIGDETEFIPAPDGYKMEIPLDGRAPFMKPTEPFMHMDQVYEQFQKTFLEKVFEPVAYETEKKSIDSLGRYISEQKWPWERSKSRTDFNQIDDRLTQTYVMAAAWLEQHANYSWVRSQLAFKHMYFPETVSALIQNTPEHPKNEELDLKQLTEDAIDFERAVKSIPFDARRSL